MDSVSSIVEFDFRSARKRVLELTFFYRKAKRAGDDMAAWALAAEIEELEREISEAHKPKTKMAALISDQKTNVITPIIPQWGAKEEARA